MAPLSLDLCGAKALWNSKLEFRDISVRDGKVSESPVGRPIDLTGFLVLPGIIDVHGDAFERQLAPRRGVVTDLRPGLLALDAELAASGITTAILAQFWSWEGGMRSPEFARRLLDALKGTRGSLNTDMRVQLRFETHLLDDYEAFEKTVSEFDVSYVVFNDHLPHRALELGKRPPRLSGQALKSGRSPEAHLELLRIMHDRTNEVGPALDRLVPALKEQNVLLGSHDDPNPEVRGRWSDRGVEIAEFPETPEVAEAARTRGDGIVLGAPNVVRGRSHAGKLSARKAVTSGLCDALASDYHYPSVLQAVLTLSGGDKDALAEYWSLVSSGPARLLGLADRGRLIPELRADLVVFDPVEGRIGGTISAGRIAHLSGRVAERFLA